MVVQQQQQQPLRRQPIVLAYAWGRRNAGDHALTLGALELLRTIVPEEELVVVSRYRDSSNPDAPDQHITSCFPGVKVFPAPFDMARHGRWRSIIQRLAGLGFMTRVLLTPPNTLNRLPRLAPMAQSRFILLNGGNLFYWHSLRRNFGRIAALAFPLQVARRLERPYGFLPQTCGELTGKVGQRVGQLFAASDFCVFRDSISLRHVEEVATLDPERVTVGPDLAFFLSNRGTNVRRLDRTVAVPERFLAVVLRTAPLGPDVAPCLDDPKRTEQQVVDLLPPVLARVVSELQLAVVFVIQVDQDNAVTERVREILAQVYGISCQKIGLSDPYDFIGLYSQATCLLSMRLHSGIFALSQGTPVVALWRRQLGEKIPAMMADLGLQNFSHELSQTTPDQLASGIKQAVEMRAKLSSQILTALAVRKAALAAFLKKRLTAEPGDAPGERL